jgi:hypothetical protein
MNEGMFIALAVIGALYLVGWPIRISLLRKNSAKVGVFPLLVPGFGGAVLIFADIMVISRYGIGWGYFPLFVHGFLFLYGLALTIKYLRNPLTEKNPDSDSDDNCGSGD